MKPSPRQLSLDEWDQRYTELVGQGMQEPSYGGPISRHVQSQQDWRLQHLAFDNSPAALRLWNFLLTENERLRQARKAGDRLVGTMKDLGTIPVMAYSLPHLRAFYPDGAWWTPCLMECSDHLLRHAERLGIDASFCPVRAMLAAFQSEEHFPLPDLLICSTGAVCDDFSAIAQRLEHLGHTILWWEMPRRRSPEHDEPACLLPGGLRAPVSQVDCVQQELERVAAALGSLAGCTLDDASLSAGIRTVNQIRSVLQQLRETVFAAPAAPLPGLELLIAEMLAIHFCSDREESLCVLKALLQEAQRRVEANQGVSPADAVRVYWVNPVADLRAMNLLEACGGRLCGSDFMFTHALDLIPEDVPSFEGLARMALADPMVGPAADRAARILTECCRSHAELVVLSRIPGASHCPGEMTAIRDLLGPALPVVEIEIPPVCDALLPALRTRLQAGIEIAQSRRT